jgi:hypothetical protein
VSPTARVARRSSLPPPRDQHETAFTRILTELVSRMPGARAAALVDPEGETVDSSGRLAPYDVKVAAAQWRVVIDEIRLRGPLSTTTFVAVRARRASYQGHVLPEGYALVIMFSRAAGLGGWRRPVSACCLALAEEAAWSLSGAGIPSWHPARVATDAQRRPVAIGEPPRVRALELVGAIASGMGAQERGWRVRFEDGLEATLVREPGGKWYVDEAGALQPPRSGRETKSR